MVVPFPPSRRQTGRSSGWSGSRWWWSAWPAPRSPSWTTASWWSGCCAPTSPTRSCCRSSSASSSSPSLTVTGPLWAAPRACCCGCCAESRCSGFRPLSSSQDALWSTASTSSSPRSEPSACWRRWCPPCCFPTWRPCSLTADWFLRGGTFLM